VVEHYFAPAPVEAPGSPAPAESTSEPEVDSRTEPNEGWSKPGIVNVARIDFDWGTVDQPGIVNGQVAKVSSNRFDDDRWTLSIHGLLRRALQISCILRAPAHNLDSVEHILLLIEIGIPKR
jgi:hypothetical protein